MGRSLRRRPPESRAESKGALPVDTVQPEGGHPLGHAVRAVRGSMQGAGCLTPPNDKRRFADAKFGTPPNGHPSNSHNMTRRTRVVGVRQATLGSASMRFRSNLVFSAN